MNTLLFIIGAIFGIITCYLFFKKKMEVTRNELEETKKILTEQQKESQLKIKNLESDLNTKRNELKVLKNQNESEQEKSEDLSSEISKLKRDSNYLVEENEKLTANIREYEMLYNAKKDEIERLNKKLNN